MINRHLSQKMILVRVARMKNHILTGYAVMFARAGGIVSVQVSE